MLNMCSNVFTSITYHILDMCVGDKIDICPLGGASDESKEQEASLPSFATVQLGLQRNVAVIT